MQLWFLAWGMGIDHFMQECQWFLASNILLDVLNPKPTCTFNKGSERLSLSSQKKSWLELQEFDITNVTDRGVDAPEIEQPYGRQAQAVLLGLVEGHSLRLLVYDDDYFGRKVADVYCDNVFIQVCHNVSLLLHLLFNKVGSCFSLQPIVGNSWHETNYHKQITH